MRRSRTNLGRAALALAILSAAASAALAADAGAGAAAAPKAKFIRSQWQSLYLAGMKIGYITQSVYAFPDGGRRLQTNRFLRRNRAAGRFGYYEMITADVDADFRPRALTCRVVSGDRQWHVTGRVEKGALVLTRTVGEKSASARVPLEKGVTFLSWALRATLLSGARTGQTHRWRVIDESLGALLPDPCLVRVIGPRGLPAAGDGRNLLGIAVGWSCGAERVAHLVESNARVLRSVWESTPMVAEATSLSGARRLNSPAEAPPAADVPGLTGERYRNPRLGLSLWVPPYPYVIHVAEPSGAVMITDLTDEAYMSVRPAYGSGPAVAVAGASAQAGQDGEAAEPLLASHPIQQEWAARFDEVTAEPRAAVVPGGAKAYNVQGIGGTARLGCTTYHFRNLLLSGEGLTWFVSLAVADRRLTAKAVLLEKVSRSIKAAAPEGRLPIQAVGLVLRSPYYGFQIRRPNMRWKVPDHVGGPLTALEIVREDHAAVALVRVLTPRKGQSLEAFAAEQAETAAETLGVEKPEPRPTTFGGQRAIEIAYEGKAILSGKPARCKTVYTQRQGRVLALVLVVAADADETAAREIEQIRRSVRFIWQAAGP